MKHLLIILVSCVFMVAYDNSVQANEYSRKTYQPILSGTWQGIEYAIDLDIIQKSIFKPEFESRWTILLVSGATLTYRVSCANRSPKVQMRCTTHSSISYRFLQQEFSDSFTTRKNDFSLVNKSICKEVPIIQKV